jgi:hypothetical protein
MSVYIHAPPDMFLSKFDYLQGLLSVLGMATKNVAGNWLAFIYSMWLYFCYMLFPTLNVARSVRYCSLSIGNNTEQNELS